MVIKQNSFQLISPCSWLTLLLLMVFLGGIERFLTIAFSLDQELEQVKIILIAQEGEQTDDEENGDTFCKRGCEPDPRYVL